MVVSQVNSQPKKDPSIKRKFSVVIIHRSYVDLFILIPHLLEHFYGRICLGKVPSGWNDVKFCITKQRCKCRGHKGIVIHHVTCVQSRYIFFDNHTYWQEWEYWHAHVTGHASVRILFAFPALHGSNRNIIATWTTSIHSDKNSVIPQTCHLSCISTNLSIS